jgi:hypothetical protein
MSEQRRAAIDLDAIQEKTLREISAADFLEALEAGGASLGNLRPWPEKKKVELLVGPENLSGMSLGGLLKGLREKKKVELEIDVKSRAAEGEFIDPRDLVSNPAVATLIQQTVATEVARQLNRK